MNLRKKAKETLDDVSDAAGQVVDSTQWATLALVAVTGVAVLALAAAVTALREIRHQAAGSSGGRR